MIANVLRLFTSILLVGGVFAGGFPVALADEKVTLPSGNVIILDSLSKTYFSGSGKWALVLKYQTSIPLSDKASLRAEAIEIWDHYFGRIANSKEMNDAAIVAFSEPESSLFGLIEKKAKHGFVFTRDGEGNWKITSDDQAVRSIFDNGLAYARAGKSAQDRGAHGEAIAFYTKATETGDLAPQERISVLNNRCDGYLREGDFTSARDDCDNAIQLAVAHELGQTLALLYYTRGELSESEGDSRRAEQDFRQAYQIWPDHPAVKAKALELGLVD